MDIFIDFDKLTWSSDCNGHEVGYPDIEIVGVYSFQPNIGPEVYMHIDMEEGEILDMWCGCDCE